MLKRYRDILYGDALRRRLASGGPFAVANATLGTDYTITQGVGRVFYNFKTTGKTMTITNTASLNVDYVAIAGGGGGGFGLLQISSPPGPVGFLELFAAQA